MALRGIQEYIARDVNNIARVEDEGNIVSIEGENLWDVATVTKVGGAWRDSRNYEFLRHIVDVNQC